MLEEDLLGNASPDVQQLGAFDIEAMTSYIKIALEAGEDFEEVMDEFFAELMVKAVNTLIDFLIDHAIIDSNTNRNLIEGSIDYLVDIILIFMAPAANLPAFAARNITLVITACWIRNFNESKNESYILSWLVRLTIDDLETLCGDNGGSIYNPH